MKYDIQSSDGFVTKMRIDIRYIASIHTSSFHVYKNIFLNLIHCYYQCEVASVVGLPALNIKETFSDKIFFKLKDTMKI